MVTISHPTNIHPIQMPGQSDLAALLSIARRTLFPQAKPLADGDAREYFQQFCSAFSFVACLRRVDDFQGRAGDWCERAERWHQERGNAAASISLSPLMCAVVAAGDINWQAPRDRWPHDVFAAVGWAGAEPIPAWRDVLATKRCRPMVPVSQSPYRDAPVPRIVQLDLVHGAGAKPFG